MNTDFIERSKIIQSISYVLTVLTPEIDRMFVVCSLFPVCGCIRFTKMQIEIIPCIGLLQFSKFCRGYDQAGHCENLYIHCKLHFIKINYPVP